MYWFVCRRLSMHWIQQSTGSPALPLIMCRSLQSVCFGLVVPDGPIIVLVQLDGEAMCRSEKAIHRVYTPKPCVVFYSHSRHRHSALFIPERMPNELGKRMLSPMV
ncbi:hypothetical protein Ddc_07206 [Ditylenchus destructor]|nr:hypothetical protein Ddc_07206 [Ditylenchus destructor]